jgi:hypothetical protein
MLTLEVLVSLCINPPDALRPSEITRSLNRTLRNKSGLPSSYPSASQADQRRRLALQRSRRLQIELLGRLRGAYSRAVLRPGDATTFAAARSRRAGQGRRHGTHSCRIRGSGFVSGIVTGAVDLGDRDPVLDARKHRDLPIGNVAGEEDHPPASCDRPIDMLEAERLDPPAQRRPTATEGGRISPRSRSLAYWRFVLPSVMALTE